MTDRRVGALVVLGRGGSYHRYARWSCKCDCGRSVEVSGAHLRNYSGKQRMQVLHPSSQKETDCFAASEEPGLQVDPSRIR